MFASALLIDDILLLVIVALAVVVGLAFLIYFIIDTIKKEIRIYKPLFVSIFDAYKILFNEIRSDIHYFLTTIKTIQNIKNKKNKG